MGQWPRGAAQGGPGGTWGQGRASVQANSAQNRCVRTLPPLRLSQKRVARLETQVPKVPLSQRLENHPDLQETASGSRFSASWKWLDRPTNTHPKPVRPRWGQGRDGSTPPQSLRGSLSS